MNSNGHIALLFSAFGYAKRLRAHGIYSMSVVPYSSNTDIQTNPLLTMKNPSLNRDLEAGQWYRPVVNHG